MDSATVPLPDAVARRVGKLQGGYRADAPRAVADLARLRSGAGKIPADCPDLWGLGVDLADCAFPGFTEEQAETAAHVALSLYALHQQSRREHGMHQGQVEIRTADASRSGGERVERFDRSLGWAVRELMPRGEVNEALRRRFAQAGTASGIGVLAYRLRGIVQLLRRDGVALDYGLLARHLLTAQRPGGMREVRSAWGQGYALYRAPRGAASDDANPADSDDQ